VLLPFAMPKYLARKFSLHCYKNALDGLSETENSERLRGDKKVGRHALRNFRGQDDFQTIKVQLRALGLIAKNDKPRSVKDSGTYWTLTPMAMK
jgi:hypothetical protein